MKSFLCETVSPYRLKFVVIILYFIFKIIIYSFFDRPNTKPTFSIWLLQHINLSFLTPTLAGSLCEDKWSLNTIQPPWFIFYLPRWRIVSVKTIGRKRVLSVQHKRVTPFQPPKSLSSTPEFRQFNTENPSVQHTPQFNTKTPQLAYKNLFFVSFLCWTEGCVWEVFGVEKTDALNWVVFGVELRGFWCWTEGFGGWKGVTFLCWTDMLNWGGPQNLK